jgi:hypothetical protein
VSLLLFRNRTHDARTYNIPEIDEVATLIVGDFDQSEDGSVMTGYLTLFLACFSVNFSRKYEQKGGILERLPMILGLL